MQLLDARLHSVEFLAEGILAFEFRPRDDGAAWPAVTAGAHIDVPLANGMVRSYSLVNPGDTHRYVIAVQEAPAGRGGSRFMHESLRVGQPLRIGAPRNAFALDEEAQGTVLVAGGIGVTPLWAMAQRLSMLGRPWTLHYCAREPMLAAYREELVALGERTGNAVHLHFDGGVRERMLDLRALLASVAPETHVYACGPAPMLSAFDAACEGRDPSTVHREYFSAPSAPAAAQAGGSGFDVVLSRSNRRVHVGASTSILDALLGAGIEVPHSCMAGICRACEVPVLEGVPDHQDLVLSEQERIEGRTMMLCCSRARTPELCLDL